MIYKNSFVTIVNNSRPEHDGQRSSQQSRSQHSQYYYLADERTSNKITESSSSSSISSASLNRRSNQDSNKNNHLYYPSSSSSCSSTQCDDEITPNPAYSIETRDSPYRPRRSQVIAYKDSNLVRILPPLPPAHSAVVVKSSPVHRHDSVSNSENDSSYYYSSAAVLKRSPPTAGLASSHTRSCLKLKQLPLFTCLKCDQQNASFTDSNYFFKIKNSSDMKERSAEHSSASSTPPPIQTQFKENSSSCKSNTTSSSSASFLSTDNNKSCDCSLTIDLESECYDDEQTKPAVAASSLLARSRSCQSKVDLQNIIRNKRQRNLTTDFYSSSHKQSSTATRRLQDQDYFDNFLKSLEDINDYLDKRLGVSSSIRAASDKSWLDNEKEIQRDSNCLIGNKNYSNLQRRANKRYFTQPIILGEKKEAITTTISNAMELKTQRRPPPPQQQQQQDRFFSLSNILTSQDEIREEREDQKVKQSLEQSMAHNDLLTVQILFQELELDCDEQIKQLDLFERCRNENRLKQKRILDELKLSLNLISQRTQEAQTRHRKDINVRKLKKRSLRFLIDRTSPHMPKKNHMELIVVKDANKKRYVVKNEVEIVSNQARNGMKRSVNNKSLLDEYFEKYCSKTGCVEKESRRDDLVVGQSNIRSTTNTTTTSSSSSTLYNCVDLIKKNHPQLVVDCDDLKAIQRRLRTVLINTDIKRSHPPLPDLNDLMNEEQKLVVGNSLSKKAIDYIDDEFVDLTDSSVKLSASSQTSHHHNNMLSLSNVSTTSSSLSSSSHKISPNRFVYIQFPLRTDGSMPPDEKENETDTPNSVNSRNSRLLNRFHSFRLDDKLTNKSGSGGGGTAFLSRINTEESTEDNKNLSYLDLTKLDKEEEFDHGTRRNSQFILVNENTTDEDKNNMRLELINLERFTLNRSQLTSRHVDIAKELELNAIHQNTTLSSVSSNVSSSTSTPSSPFTSQKPIAPQPPPTTTTGVDQSTPKSGRHTANIVLSSLKRSIKRSSFNMKRNQNKNNAANSLSSTPDSLPKGKLDTTTDSPVRPPQSDTACNERVTRRKEKWASFIKPHRPSLKSSKLQLNTLSVRQFVKLRKFGLVRLTGIMDKHIPSYSQKSSWNRLKTMPKFMRRNQKSIDIEQYKSKQVFTVPLRLVYQRHGQPLPMPILQIMKYLRHNSATAVGIFRKSGSKYRMSMIREQIEKNNSFNLELIHRKLEEAVSSSGKIVSATNGTSPELNSIGSGLSSQSTSKSDLVADYECSSLSSPPASANGIYESGFLSTETIAIDLADILKQYFRELPECLFTNKFSQTLIDIFTYVPENERTEAVQYCFLLIDDESREAIQCLLFFLHDISQNSATNKMDARNIAICLAPTLLNMNNLRDMSSASAVSSSTTTTSQVISSSNTNNANLVSNGQATNGSLYSKQCNASLDCLTFMIEQANRLFQVPGEAFTKCQFNKNDYCLSLTLNELLGSYSNTVLNFYVNDRIEEMLKEIKDKPKNWTKFRTESSLVDVSYKNIEDDNAGIRLWKLSIEIDAPAKEILDQILNARSEWDDELVDFKIIDSLNSQTDLIQYAMHFMPPQPNREFCELRCWKEAIHITNNNTNGSSSSSSTGSSVKRTSYFVFSTSIDSDKSSSPSSCAASSSEVRGNTLRTFYLIEACLNNPNRSVVYQLHRADYKGFSADWYQKIQPHFLKRCLLNLKDSLK